ncbi:MAG: hypothetical protein NTY30_02075 [Candidatus Berkelbacteria bacterium]|nr:hypothetical protein [Candidatus Berkelbacteria bacterium]
MGNYKDTITYKQATEAYELTYKQNQAEGALRNSVKALIEFLGFARASGEELLEDYLDLAKDHKIIIVRPTSLSSLSSKSSLSSDLNYLIDSITRTNYLLDR